MTLKLTHYRKPRPLARLGGVADIDSAYDQRMATPQPGIFAQGTRAHYHLEFDLQPGVSEASICAAVGRLREPAVTAGGSNIVVGFGPDLWHRLNRDDAPETLAPYVEIEGSGGRA